LMEITLIALIFSFLTKKWVQAPYCMNAKRGRKYSFETHLNLG